MAAPTRQRNTLVEAIELTRRASSSMMIALSISAWSASGIVASAVATRSSKTSTSIGSMSTSLAGMSRASGRSTISGPWASDRLPSGDLEVLHESQDSSRLAPAGERSVASQSTQTSATRPTRRDEEGATRQAVRGHGAVCPD